MCTCDHITRLPLFASVCLLAYAASGCHLYGLGEVVGNSETRCGQDDQASSSKRIRTAHDDDVVCCGLKHLLVGKRARRRPNITIQLKQTY